MAVKKKNTKNAPKKLKKKSPVPKNIKKKNATSAAKNIKDSTAKKSALKNKNQQASKKNKPSKSKNTGVRSKKTSTPSKKSTPVKSKTLSKSSKVASKKSSVSSVAKTKKNQAHKNNKKHTPASKPSTTKHTTIASVKQNPLDKPKTAPKATIKNTAKNKTKNNPTSTHKKITDTKSYTNRDTTVTPKIKSGSQEPITLEKVYEVTNDENFLPKSISTSEKTAFSDSLNQDINSVYSRTSDDIPEPAGKFTMEFLCKASPELLYKFLTDPIELSEWFCDDVNIRNGIYTFVWNGVPQQARLVKQERNALVKFQWIDKNDGSYFEFNINKNNITGDVLLHVTDFSSPEELESNKMWWTNKINELKHILGLQY